MAAAVPTVWDASEQAEIALGKAIRRLDGIEGALGEKLAGRVLMDLQAVINPASPARVVVVGEFNAGKSSLINAIMGCNVLPTGIIPTTATLNEVQYGDRATVQVVERDGTITLLDFDEAALKQFTARYGDHNHVDVIRVQSPEVPTDVVFYDTPGVNDINESRAELVYQLIPDADLILFVMDVQQALKQTEERFLRYRLLGESLTKIVYVLNHCDRVNSSDVAATVDRVQSSVGRIYKDMAQEMTRRGAMILAGQLEHASTRVKVIPLSARGALRTGTSTSQEIVHGFEELCRIIRELQVVSSRKYSQLRKVAVGVCRSLASIESYLRDVRSLQSRGRTDSSDIARRLRHEADHICTLARRARTTQEELMATVNRTIKSSVDTIRVEALARFTSGEDASVQGFIQGELQRTVEAQLEYVNSTLVSLGENADRLDVTARDLMQPVREFDGTQEDDKSLEKMSSDPLLQMIAQVAVPIVIFQLGWIGILGLLAAPLARNAWAQSRQQRAFAEHLERALEDARREIVARFDNMIGLVCVRIIDHACGRMDRTQATLRVLLEFNGDLDEGQLAALEREVGATKDDVRQALVLLQSI